jgi:hypothetical protein
LKSGLFLTKTIPSVVIAVIVGWATAGLQRRGMAASARGGLDISRSLGRGKLRHNDNGQ